MSVASIPDLLSGTVEKYGDRCAVVDGSTELTYAELSERARGFAAAIVATGVEPGDRVAICACNSVEWIVAALGLFDAGAVLVPVNTRFKGVEAGGILARSGARVLVTVTDFLGADYVLMLREGGVPTPALETVVVAHGPARDGTVPWAGFLGRASSEHFAEVDQRCRDV